MGSSADPISILMLEDSPLDADLTEAMLKRAGIQAHVTRVDTRDAFCTALAARSYDVILADYALPEFDGIAALEIARGAAPDTPFILVSGVLGEEFAIDAIHRGATDYVLKSRLERLPTALTRAINEANNAAERKRAAEELRQTQEFARRIIESSRDCVMILQTDGALLSMNGFGRKLMGLAEDENVAGRPFVAFWEDAFHDAALAAFESARQGGAGAFEANSRGSGFFWDVLVTPVLDSEGRPEQIAAFARDITDRKRNEAERQALHARERQARAEAETRSVELQRSLDDLQHFAYAASHDLREPLRVIALYGQLLQRRLRTQLDTDSLTSFNYIVQGAHRLDALLTEIQRYSGVVHATEEFGPCEMTAVAEEAVRNCGVAAAESGGTITYDGLPRVRGNHGQLVQVLQNLIENALKYRSRELPQVQITAVENDDGAGYLFRVRDNGIGFQQQYAERIFGLFKRLHSHEYPGTGMGLAICRRIVERHKGTIWAESAPGEGSSFFFTLPKG